MLDKFIVLLKFVLQSVENVYKQVFVIMLVLAGTGFPLRSRVFNEVNPQMSLEKMYFKAAEKDDDEDDEDWDEDEEWEDEDENLEDA